MKFRAISWKFDVLSISACNLKFGSKNPICDTCNCDYLLHTIGLFRFCLIDFHLNIDFPSQFCVYYCIVELTNKGMNLVDGSRV